VVPSADLAAQVLAVFKSLSAHTSVICEPLGSGAPALIAIATPGLLKQHISLCSGLRFLVLDEADKLLSGSSSSAWLDNLLKSQSPGGFQCQKLLFSASLSYDPQILASLKLNNPLLFSAESALPPNLSEVHATHLSLNDFHTL